MEFKIKIKGHVYSSNQASNNRISQIIFHDDETLVYVETKREYEGIEDYVGFYIEMPPSGIKQAICEVNGRWIKETEKKENKKMLDDEAVNSLFGNVFSKKHE